MIQPVTDRLAIGDAAAIYDPPDGWTLVNVAREHPPGDVRFPLADGPGNPRPVLEEAAREVVRRLEDGERVVVACNAGVSRSTTVAALAVALHQGLSWPEALARVRAHHPRGNPHPALAGLAVDILSDTGDTNLRL